MVALPITGRTLTFVRVGTGILHDVQGSCGDGTTGSTSTTTNTVTTANRLPRVEQRKAEQECDGEREQHNQRRISFLLLRSGGSGRSAVECRFFVHNVVVLLVRFVAVVVFVSFRFSTHNRLWDDDHKTESKPTSILVVADPTDLDTSKKHTS